MSINTKTTLNLLVSNLFVIIIALIQHWDIQEVMLVYLVQSILIGVFHYKRILNLDTFSTENFKINGSPVEPTRATKIFTSNFFLFHYMMFHLVYLIFIFAGFQGNSGLISTLNDGMFLLYFILGTILFAYNHYTSYKSYLEVDKKRIQNIGTLMFFPYARILPMHLTLIFAVNTSIFPSLPLLFFLILKMLADIIMHLVSHNGLKQFT